MKAGMVAAPKTDEQEARGIPTRRDAIRSAFLSQQRESKIVTLEDGMEVEVRQSLVGEMLDGLKTEDVKTRMIGLMIRNCFVPTTGEAVFEESDAAALANSPAGGYWQKLMDAMNSMTLAVKIEEAEKNSQETGSTS